MLDDQLKSSIQNAYRAYLAGKSHAPRYGQKLMIAEIARTLGTIERDGEGRRKGKAHICVVEAGTGTGKTVAYLLAALPIAKALGKRVVLATATVALQEQVVHKDIPEVLRHSELDFSFVLAKGRGRYLCLSKLDRIVTQQDNSQLIPTYEDDGGFVSADQLALYEDMMAQLVDGEWNGDRDSWMTELDAEEWGRVTTDHRQCSGRKCSFVRQCAFFKARDAVNDANLIVANHDLVLADLALGGGAILPAPEETIYIFDEGHHLPDKALNHFSAHLRYRSTIRWLGQSEGQWPSLSAPLADATYFNELGNGLVPVLSECRKTLEQGLGVIDGIVTEGVEAGQEQRLRFLRGVAPAGLESLAQSLSEHFAELASLLKKLYAELEDLIDEDAPLIPKNECEALYPMLGSWLARAEASHALWLQYCHTAFDESWPQARWITVLEFNEQRDFEIVACPILASRALEKDLWSKCFAAVVTSATLTALNSFDRFQMRAGTYSESHYSRVPSPFHFSENAVLSIPSSAVEANRGGPHTESVIDLLPEVLDSEKGSLVLFSSRRQMLDVFEGLQSALRERVLIQGAQSKHALIAEHRKRVDAGKGSVIFGLASFAEGVDLPGAYCEHVVIAKIPFAVPDDPLEAAIAEWVEARGGNAFMQISVPDASMRLIQACGRLLRTESDQGRVTILDRRLITKRYGKSLLDALPPFRREF